MAPVAGADGSVRAGDHGAGDRDLPSVEPVAEVAGGGAVVAEVSRLVAPEGLHERVDQTVLAELDQHVGHTLVGREGEPLVHGADRVVDQLDRLVHALGQCAEPTGQAVGRGTDSSCGSG